MEGQNSDNQHLNDKTPNRIAGWGYVYDWFLFYENLFPRVFDRSLRGSRYREEIRRSTIYDIKRLDPAGVIPIAILAETEYLLIDCADLQQRCILFGFFCGHAVEWLVIIPA